MSVLRKKRRVLDEQFLSSLETLDLFIHKLMSGRFGGVRRSYGAGSSCEFLDYREYAPGDDLRRIDWSLVGRLEKYYIKRFVDERQQETHIYLDLSRSMEADAAGQKAVTALRAAAALGYLSVQNMDRAAYRLLRGEACDDLCGAIMGREAFYKAAEALEDIVFSGADQMGQAVRNDPMPGYDDGLSILISDFLTDSDWRSAVDYLLSRKREVALIRIITPEEAEPLYVGPSALMDCEALSDSDRRNLRLSIDRAALRAYHQALQDYDADMRAFCVSRGVALVTLRTDLPVADALIRQGFSAELLR